MASFMTAPLAMAGIRERQLSLAALRELFTHPQPPCLTLLMPTYRRPPDNAVGRRTFAGLVDTLSDQLAAHGHLVGGRFTVADLNMAEVLRYAQGHDDLMSQFPATRDWLTACQQRQGFVQMVALREAEPA